MSQYLLELSAVLPTSTTHDCLEIRFREMRFGFQQQNRHHGGTTATWSFWQGPLVSRQPHSPAANHRLRMFTRPLRVWNVAGFNMTLTTADTMQQIYINEETNSWYQWGNPKHCTTWCKFKIFILIGSVHLHLWQTSRDFREGKVSVTVRIYPNICHYIQTRLFIEDPVIFKKSSAGSF